MFKVIHARVACVFALMLMSGVTGCASAPEPAPTPAPEPAPEPEGLAYPESPRQAVAETLHGETVSDPYRWLEDVEDADVKAWMKAQDALARQELGEMGGRDALTARLKELYYVDSVSAPIKRGERFFYRRRLATKEKAIIYWKQGQEGDEQVLLDPNAMSEAKGENVSLGRWVPSWDGKWVAYSLKANNADEATLYVMDVATGEISEGDTIQGAKYARPNWTPDSDGFYYTWLPTDPSIPTADRPGFSEIRYHKLGSDPASDAIVHEKLGDPKVFLSVSLSRDGRWLFVYHQRGWSSNEIYVRDLKKRGNAEFELLFKGEGAQAYVTAWKKHFYITTNEDAPRYMVYRTLNTRRARKNWKVVVEEPEDKVIDNVQIVGGRLVITSLKDVSAHMEVRELNGEVVREVPLPGIGASFGMTGNPDEDTAYYSFMSYTTPMQIYETSVKTGESTLWTEVKLPIDASPYEVELVRYPSKDGTEISMFIVRRKDMPRDGSTPLQLYGYGGFQISMRPYFSSTLYPWLEAGGAYAVPHLRGGGEYGEAWHKAGMGVNKQNVFDDFIAAAEYLIKEGYTSADKLAIRGGSNGGLLVGAAMTQRPDLFRAVVCSVPLLDMVRYHLFGSGKTWIAEYGSADDPEQFKALLAYSPYHNVKPETAYPAMLMMSADTDDRVDPLHARKMVAALQHANQGEHPILLRIEAQAGHGGADLVKQRVEQSADMLAFMMDQLGMAPAQADADATGAAPVDAATPGAEPAEDAPADDSAPAPRVR